MLHFLLTIPDLVLYGCVVLIAVAIMMNAWMASRTWRVRSQIGTLAATLEATTGADKSRKRDGLSLAEIDEIRDRC